MSEHQTPDALVEAVARTLAQRVAETIGRDADEYWQDVGASFVDDARAALDASAVPDLLEALKQARNWMAGCRGSDNQVAAADHVIKKTTGGAA
jgi:hypothetical protein